jgi:carboxyl-terminal processing protease
MAERFLMVAVFFPMLIFDFATEYYYKNPNVNLKNFKLSDSDFKTFKGFLNKNDFSFTTNTEKALFKAYKTATKENLNDAIGTEYNALIASLNKSKDKAIDAHKNYILKKLTEEIIKRYSYREGLYDYYKTKDAYIEKSKQILGNTATYTDYLR